MNIKTGMLLTLLAFFYDHEGETFYSNELARRLNLPDKRNLIKKLKELEKEGILKMEQKGNLKLYSINKNYPLYNEYKKIILKTAGIEQMLKNALSQIKGVQRAFIFGSYVRNKMDVSSDIDVMVIGDQDTAEVQTKISNIQKRFDRDINVINIGSREFETKKNDPFISAVLKEKLTELI